jgi:hypothetical protein
MNADHLGLYRQGEAARRVGKGFDDNESGQEWGQSATQPWPPASRRAVGRVGTSA